MASPLLGLCRAGTRAPRLSPALRFISPYRSVSRATTTTMMAATTTTSTTVVSLYGRRLASSSAKAKAKANSKPKPKPPTSRWRMVNFATAGVFAVAIILLYSTDTRAGLHNHLVPKLMRGVFGDAEDAHHFSTSALGTLYALGLHPRERASFNSTYIPVEAFGTTLTNPIGISAGLDKHADIPDALFAIGAGVVEVGGCTPMPQDGNPRPRLFRVPRIDGLVNRFGLNSIGADAMAAKLRERVRRFARDNCIEGGEQAVLDGEADVPPGSLLAGRLLLVQIAKQKETDEADAKAVAADYVYCVQRLAPYADVIVVNVSSPNTPGLRDLQATGPLTRLLSAVVDEAARTKRKTKPKVMVKVSPDEDSASQIEGIAQAVISSGVDGVIVGNTTKRRVGVVPEGVKLPLRERKALAEEGGFSGPMLFDRTLDLVQQYRRVLDRDVLRAGGGQRDRKVIFATGGITDGDKALRVLDAGASVAMVYTGLVYGGVGTVTHMKQKIRKELDKSG